MPQIELDDIMTFLLSKYNEQDIKNSLERVIKEFENLSKPKSDFELDPELMHKIMNRKYG